MQPKVPKCRILNFVLFQSSKFSDPRLPARERPRAQMFALPATPTLVFPPGLQCPAWPLTQGKGQEQWQGAGAAARGGPVHQPRSAGPGSPKKSLPPPSSPPSRDPGAREGAWKLILEPRGNETTPLAGTLATGQGNTQGGWLAGSVSVGRGGNLLFILTPAHTPPKRRRNW